MSFQNPRCPLKGLQRSKGSCTTPGCPAPSEALLCALLVTVRRLSLESSHSQIAAVGSVLLTLQGGGEKYQQLPKNTFANYDLAPVQPRHSNTSCCSPFSMTLQAGGKQPLEVHYHQVPAKKYLEQILK